MGAEHSQPITENVRDHKSFAFTCVCNPYTRILSSFFDKICGIQRNGKRYRGNLVPSIIQKYGIEVGGDDGQIRSTRSSRSADFCSLPATRYGFANPWTLTSTGQPCPGISRPSS